MNNEYKQLKKMLEYETQLFNQGIKHIVGVDEVGRGPLAGPLVVASVILDIEKLLTQTNNDVLYEMINDSKKLTEKKRDVLDKFIRNEAIEYTIVEISHTDIDENGMSWAIQTAFSTTINNLRTMPEHILTDAVKIKTIDQTKQTNIIKGDATSISIAAASIIAKVYRDNLMNEYSKIYEQYGFAKHKGYGTAQHIAAIKQHGYCDIHRKSFKLNI